MDIIIWLATSNNLSILLCMTIVAVVCQIQSDLISFIEYYIISCNLNGMTQSLKSQLDSSCQPSGRAIHVSQISTRIYGGIPGDHPCGNFLMISLRKWRGNEREFSMWIFPHPFPVESLGSFLRGNFPRVSLKNFKMQFNHMKTVPAMWKSSSDDLVSFFGEIKIITGLGKFPSHFNPDLKIFHQFLRGFSFHLQPKFPCGFPPQTTTIPVDSPRNQRDFARWEITPKSKFL